jgi:hypothetical protein
MKRLITAGLALIALASVAPANALTERFDEARRDNLNKGLTQEGSISDRQYDEFVDGLNRLTDRFVDEHRDTLRR